MSLKLYTPHPVSMEPDPVIEELLSPPVDMLVLFYFLSIYKIRKEEAKTQVKTHTQRKDDHKRSRSRLRNYSPDKL